MAWARIDDVFPECKKILGVRDADLKFPASVPLILTALQLRAICYCSRNLTDGFLPAGAVPGILVGLEGEGWIQRMIDAGFWERCETDAAPHRSARLTGYLVHDFLDYNPSKKARMKATEQRRNAAKSRWKSKKGEMRDRMRDLMRAACPPHEPRTDPHPQDQEPKIPPMIPPPPPAGRKAGREPTDRAGVSRKIPTEGAPASRRGSSRSGAPPPSCADCGAVVALLNELAGKKFGANKAALKNLHARHQEFGLEACLRVVRVMVLSWLGTDMEEYLAPTTLFRPTKFERYLNKKPPQAPPKRTFDRLSPSGSEEYRRQRAMLERISPERRDACLSYLKHLIGEKEKALDSARELMSGPAYMVLDAPAQVDRLMKDLEELRTEIAFLEAGKEDA